MSQHFPSPRGLVLFLHVAKTGGTSVESILLRLKILSKGASARGSHGGGRHGLTHHYYRHRGSYAFSFAFVRHPKSYYESMWRYWSSQNWRVFEDGGWHPWRCLDGLGSPDFNQFVTNVCNREPAFVTRMYEWYVGPAGGETVDFIGRTENLRDDLIDVLTRCGYEGHENTCRRVPPANVSPKLPLTWDDAVLERVLELESSAIRRWWP